MNTILKNKSLAKGWKKIPIAWLQLKYQRNQTIMGIIGVCCITFLLLIQIGLKEAFSDGALKLPKSFEGDIFLTNSVSSTVMQPAGFSARYLYEALALDSVESVAPFYITSTLWHDQENSLYRIRTNVLGISVNVPTLNLPGLKENLPKLKIEKQALFDRDSRNEFADIIAGVEKKGQVSTEILTSGDMQKVKVKGLFQLGVNNAFDATFIVSQSTFSKLFNRDPLKIDVGFINLKPNADSDRAVKQLRKRLPKNIIVLSKRDLIERETEFHENTSPVGFVFRFILGITVVVSNFILYQIFYVKVTNNLGSYAVLKALGFSNKDLIFVILEEAIILGAIGYFPGVLISSIAYNYLVESTKMAVIMHFASLVTVLGLIFLICLVAAGISVMKLKEADPADVFS